ncbi:MAG: tetratricopeptide repeat protein [Bacteroidia bacterium]
MRRLFPFFILIVLGLAACQPNAKNEHEDLNTLRKEFWNDKNNETNVKMATRLDSAYKAYVINHPADTGNAELIFENARLHLGPLNNPDVAVSLLEQLYLKYPESPRAPEAMYQSAYVLENILQLPDNARKRYQMVIDKYPDHPFAKEAQITIKFVGKDPEEMLKAITDSANKAKTDTLAGTKP